MPIVTINGQDYDVYIDLADALIYWQGQVESTTILGLDSDQQGACIVSMTRTLDRQVWQGAPTALSGQLHAWPRTGLSYADGTSVASDSVPIQVIDACAEGASQLAAGSNLQDTPNTFDAQKMLKAGSVTIMNFREVGPFPRFPQVIQELIGLWLGGGAVTLGSESYGTRGKGISSHQYNVNQGF